MEIDRRVDDHPRKEELEKEVDPVHARNIRLIDPHIWIKEKRCLVIVHILEVVEIAHHDEDRGQQEYRSGEVHERKSKALDDHPCNKRRKEPCKRRECLENPSEYARVFIFRVAFDEDVEVEIQDRDQCCLEDEEGDDEPRAVEERET